MDEIVKMLSKYEKDFNAMDHVQMKDIVDSIDGFVHDLRSCNWDWEKWAGEED